MDTQTYLFIANAAVWCGLGGYVFFLGLQSSRIEKRLAQLDLLDGDTNE